MLTGRLLLILIVLASTLAARQPAVASAAEQQTLPGERTTWVQRLGTGVTRSFSRIGLMQRVAIRVPSPQLTLAGGYTTRAVAARPPDPLRTCLPPPSAA